MSPKTQAKEYFMAYDNADADTRGPFSTIEEAKKAADDESCVIYEAVPILKGLETTGLNWQTYNEKD